MPRRQQVARHGRLEHLRRAGDLGGAHRQLVARGCGRGGRSRRWRRRSRGRRRPPRAGSRRASGAASSSGARAQRHRAAGLGLLASPCRPESAYPRRTSRWYAERARGLLELGVAPRGEAAGVHVARRRAPRRRRWRRPARRAAPRRRRAPSCRRSAAPRRRGARARTPASWPRRPPPADPARPRPSMRRHRVAGGAEPRGTREHRSTATDRIRGRVTPGRARPRCRESRGTCPAAPGAAGRRRRVARVGSWRADRPHQRLLPAAARWHRDAGPRARRAPGRRGPRRPRHHRDPGRRRTPWHRDARRRHRAPRDRAHAGRPARAPARELGDPHAARARRRRGRAPTRCTCTGEWSRRSPTRARASRASSTCRPSRRSTACGAGSSSPPRASPTCSRTGPAGAWCSPR